MKNTKKLIKIFMGIVLLSITLVFSSCGGGGDGDARNVTISWVPNGERAVNSDGGGYTVYYSQTTGFELAAATEAVALPYDATLGYTPYSFERSLATGIWYVKMKAYGKPLGGALAESPISSEYSFTVQ